jgi:hypothetical protein
MGWVLPLVESEVEGSAGSVDVLEFDGPGDLRTLADLGLKLAQGKQLLSQVQQAVVAAQCRDHAAQRPACRGCGAVCRVKDYRPRQIATLFGRVTVRLPRFRCAGCRGEQAGIEWPPQCRSTSEFDQVRAQFSAFLPYRVAAGVLEQLLPLDAGTDPETLRAQTLKIGEDLRDAAPAEPATAAAAITVSVDSTFIRSCEEDQRHLEVRLGNVETPDGAWQVFAAVARTDTAIETLIQRGLAAVGHTGKTDLTAFTDGCSGLRSMLVNAGVKAPPYLDWFHIAMRLRHAERVAGSLPIDTLEREHAKTVIVTEIDRLHWRIWNGKAKDAKLTLERIRDVMPVFRGEGDRKRDPSSRRLCARDRPLSDQPERLAGQRCRAPSRRPAGRHVDHGRNRQLPGQSSHEQVTTDAVVPPRC